MRPNPITATIPLDEAGVHHGHLQLPYSRDDSAWGSIMIPICVIKNGEKNGPTALLTGANHGDEYEGPLALQHLAYHLKAEEITGRVIIVPAFNYPAFLAAKRTSPIDSGNLNRLFPGKPDGSVTEKIADYFQRTLIPMADVVLDIHAGGQTLDFVPFAASHILDNNLDNKLNNQTQQQNCHAAMLAFNAPYSIVLKELDDVGMYDTAVEQQGKTFVSTELGGGATATARSTAIARKGISNFLIHAGILSGEIELEPSLMLDMSAPDSTLISQDNGLIDYCVDLEQAVNAGDIIARIWSTEHTGRDPIEYRAKTTGILAGRHFPGLIKNGDFLALIAKIVE